MCLLASSYSEEMPQEIAAFFSQHPARHLCVMIQSGFRGEVDHAPARPGFWISGTIHDPRDARMQHGAQTHRAGFQCDLDRCPG